MHHYDFHIGDYMKATAHLSNEEDLCYRRLLDMYYDTESPIPLETDWVSRRLRIGTEVVFAVLSDFFIKRDDGWHSLRCDEEIAHYKAICEKNREVGKLGGRPKKTQTVTVGNRLETESNPNHEPVTNNQIITPDKPATKRGSVVSQDFTPNETSIRLADELGVDWESELPKFIDHHTHKGTIGKDWNAGFRTWLNNSVKFGGAKKVPVAANGVLRSSAIC